MMPIVRFCRPSARVHARSEVIAVNAAHYKGDRDFFQGMGQKENWNREKERQNRLEKRTFIASDGRKDEPLASSVRLTLIKPNTFLS
jgi:hypothetical protein